MASEEKDSAKGGVQKPSGRQSTQADIAQGTSGDRLKGQAPSGIGSSQGQDTERREGEGEGERPSAGTADVQRGTADVERGTGGREGTDSLTKDPTGAYKERP